MRRAAKVDGNQQAIVAALEAAGCAVQSLAGVGQGVPDLLVWVPGWWVKTPKDYASANVGGAREVTSGRYVLIECKDGSSFTPAQKKFHSTWPGPCHVANNPEEALLIVGATNAC